MLESRLNHLCSLRVSAIIFVFASRFNCLRARRGSCAARSFTFQLFTRAGKDCGRYCFFFRRTIQLYHPLDLERILSLETCSRSFTKLWMIGAPFAVSVVSLFYCWVLAREMLFIQWMRLQYSFARLSSLTQIIDVFVAHLPLLMLLLLLMLWQPPPSLLSSVRSLLCVMNSTSMLWCK